MIDFSNTKLLIVDLDNTVCDTFHTISKKQWRLAAKALEAKGFRREAGIVARNLGRHSFKLTIKGFTPEQQRIGLAAYDSVGVKELRLYPDAKSILALPIPKVLVTRGEPELQHRKIKHLRIGKLFRRVYCVPTMDRKATAFKRILKDYGLKPGQCLVIGDRIEEEIVDANSLKIPSVLIDRPDWPTYRGVARPDLTVKSLEKVALQLKKGLL